MASMSRICIPAAGETFQEAQEMRTCLMNMKERVGNTKISKEKLLPELVDVSSEVVADNTKPVTAIPIKSPRGEPI